MTTPILAIKLAIPPRRAALTRRDRLVSQLNEGMHCKLALVAAPAGFGKTTLVTTWVAENNTPTAWLSLDSTDADPSRFLTYLVAAVQTVVPGVGEHALEALQFSQTLQVEAILTGLINDLDTIDHPIVLVLDDYHLVNISPVNNAVAFLLDHLPPSVHIVITTREDPQLPLPRLRARGEMIDLRAADLRFTTHEAAQFLEHVMDLDISADDVAVLETRTEGWIAGLQLAALSMHGRDDLGGFIQAFAGDDRFIIDYLVEEVLRRQPPDVRRFLLQTSMLQRMSGSLCDAVTARNDSTALLESLERANLFVVSLDNKRQWYRYHQLFAEVLRATARDDGPDALASRHRRASEWFEHHAMPHDAIRHAFAANDSMRAARLIELVAVRMLGTSSEEMLWGWLESLPDALVARMPVVATYYGFASFSRAGLDAAESRFRSAEQWLDASGDTAAGEMIVANEVAFRSLPGTIAVGRAYSAGARADIAGTIRFARQALSMTPEDDDLWRGAALAVLGIGLWTLGELDTAYQSFDEGKSRLEKAGYMQFQIVSVHILADIRLAQARLREAERIYTRSLALATRNGAALWGTADTLVGLSELCLERNNIESALQFLHRSKELGDHAGLLDTRHRWYTAMAGIMQAEGDLDGALAMLDEAERLYVRGADPDLRPIATQKVRVWIAQGRLTDATLWTSEQHLRIDENVGYLREFNQLMVARVRIARAREERDSRALDDALSLLGSLLEAAERAERWDSVIRIRIVQALGYEAANDVPAALVSLGQALSLAEPEGYVRVFIGEGPPMERLLTEAWKQDIAPDYVSQLRDAMLAGVGDASSTRPTATYLLSERELEVLRLVASGLSNREISDALYLALDTVKGHNRRIFNKLGVQRRTEAIARARELGVLEA